MPLNWDEDDEDLTEIEFKKRPTSHFSPQTVSPTDKVAIPSPALAPALARDRFAAFLIDSLVGFYLYWVLGYGLLRFFNLTNIHILHQGRGRLVLHLIATLVLLFFYYIAMESVLGATLGKLLCRLRVVEEKGEAAALGSIFIRNFLRVVDYPLLFLIAIIAMESSSLNQRLGDRAAKTIVIKKTRRRIPSVDLVHTPLASTLSRLFAETIDLILALGLCYGLLLLMRPDRPLLSSVLYFSIPIIFILYYATLEFLTGTTPGKALFKRSVILENGEPPDGTAAILRNLLRPIDYLFGYPLIALSKRKQRLGDMLADTLVVAQASAKKGFLGSLSALLLIATLLYTGFKNPQHMTPKTFLSCPLSKTQKFVPNSNPETQPETLPSNNEKTSLLSTSDKLTLDEFYLATGPSPAQIRKDGIFRSGDLIFIFFKISGLQLNDKKETVLSEDLLVEDPDGKILLSQPNIVELSKAIDENRPAMLFANQINIPKDSIQGKYRAVFTINDKVAETQFSFEKFFEIQ